MAQDKWRINDVLIVLPGITGSVLEKAGTECWAPAPSGILNYITSFGQSIDWLHLKHEDPEYDDGVRATRLIPYTVIPGLESFDGYTGIKSHLFSKLQLTVGDANKDGPAANYFEFPYDWRRDNRVTAKRLKCLIDRELPKWRRQNDKPDAKVILLGHSMGGLIARYYIEVLEGFEYTKALITFGTPHRGSVNAIDYLANGYRKSGVMLSQFTSVMRSLPSVYQLLPRYQAVQDVGGTWTSVSETDIKNIDRKRAHDAAEFYKEIDAAYERNKGADEYEVELLPIFGWGHETLQSAVVMPDHRIEVRNGLPPSVEDVFANGDGTVPRVSAIPIELNDKPLRWWPVNQKHATIQNNRTLVANLAQVVVALQGKLAAPARGLPPAESDRRVELQVDQVYLSNESVGIRVKLTSQKDPGSVNVEIASVSDISCHRTLHLVPSGNTWTGEVTSLPPGAYRATVQLQNDGAGPPDAVSDIFEVLLQSS